MKEQEIQPLLHGDLLVNMQECADRKTALYSIGFIFSFWLRQTLYMVDESEMEAYVLHLQNVSAVWECDGGGGVEFIARQCAMYVLKESKEMSYWLAKL